MRCLLLPRTLKARLQRRNGNVETPASQSNQNSFCKSYLCEDYNPGEIRINFSRPHAYKRESNMGGIFGASIRLKHNVPRPYHGHGRINSIEAYKRQRRRGQKTEENQEENKTKDRGEKVEKTNRKGKQRRAESK
jgi:hypothetical protein